MVKERPAMRIFRFWIQKIIFQPSNFMFYDYFFVEFSKDISWGVSMDGKSSWNIFGKLDKKVVVKHEIRRLENNFLDPKSKNPHGRSLFYHSYLRSDLAAENFDFGFRKHARSRKVAMKPGGNKAIPRYAVDVRWMRCVLKYLWDE